MKSHSLLAFLFLVNWCLTFLSCWYLFLLNIDIPSLWVLLMCLGMDFFGFILFGVSELLKPITEVCFNKIWEVLSHYFFKIFFCTAFFLFSWSSDDVNVRSFSIVSEVSGWVFDHFLGVIFLSVIQVGTFLSSYLQVCWVLILSFPFYYWAHLGSFKISVTEFLFGLLYIFCLFAESFTFSRCFKSPSTL